MEKFSEQVLGYLKTFDKIYLLDLWSASAREPNLFLCAEILECSVTTLNRSWRFWFQPRDQLKELAHSALITFPNTLEDEKEEKCTLPQWWSQQIPCECGGP